MTRGRTLDKTDCNIHPHEITAIFSVNGITKMNSGVSKTANSFFTYGVNCIMTRHNHCAAIMVSKVIELDCVFYSWLHHICPLSFAHATPKYS
jgi:hypothetical protein